MSTKYATVTLDITGTGQTMIGPNKDEAWQVEGVYVYASLDDKEATAITYVGPDLDHLTLIDGTLTGSTGDATEKIGTVTYPDKVWTTWENGHAGALATMKVIIKDMEHGQ
jgi:PDZ domain-containing secreted protein